ncbi:MAG: hypothetical protein LBM27_02190 [Lactobacillaceae bacterium]|jgi:hypothetical protein|nr:hypothetical protein [Lactobacillaceae bacterium]
MINLLLEIGKYLIGAVVGSGITFKIMSSHNKMVQKGKNVNGGMNQIGNQEINTKSRE